MSLPTDPQRAAIARAIQDFCAAPGRCAQWSALADPDRPIAFGAAQPMPAASVAKVAVAVALADKIAAGELDAAARTPVCAFGQTRYCSILAGLDPQSTLSLGEIIRLALITSDNPLAVHLQRLVSFAEINAALARLGLSDATHMAAGFTEAELGPANRVNTMSAADADLLFRAVATHPPYADIRRALENNLRNSRMPRLLPESAVVMHKTGSLDGVANDAGVVFGGACDYALSIFTDAQPDTLATENAIARCAAQIHAVLNP